MAFSVSSSYLQFKSVVYKKKQQKFLKNSRHSSVKSCQNKTSLAKHIHVF